MTEWPALHLYTLLAPAVVDPLEPLGLVGVGGLQGHFQVVVRLLRGQVDHIKLGVDAEEAALVILQQLFLLQSHGKSSTDHDG